MARSILFNTRLPNSPQLGDNYFRLDAKVYVAGCVTHAKDVLTDTLEEPARNEFIETSKILDKLWSQYPSSFQAPLNDLLANDVSRILPNESWNSDWEDAIIQAAAYALSLVCRDQYLADAAQEAHESLHQAYWSILSSRPGQSQSYPTDEELQQVEKSCSLCSAEIEFQLAFLKAIEAIHDQPPPVYALMLRQMNRTN